MVTALAQEICKADWRVASAGGAGGAGGDSLAVEEAGVHMCLKKLALQDRARAHHSLGEAVAHFLDSETVSILIHLFFYKIMIESPPNIDHILNNTFIFCKK